MNTDRRFFRFCWASGVAVRDRCCLAENYFTNKFFRRSYFSVWCCIRFSSFSARSFACVTSQHCLGPARVLACVCRWHVGGLAVCYLELERFSLGSEGEKTGLRSILRLIINKTRKGSIGMIFLDNNNKTGLLCCPRPSSNQIYFKILPEWLRNNFSSWFSHEAFPRTAKKPSRRNPSAETPCPRPEGLALHFHRRLPGSLQQLTNSISSRANNKGKKVKSKKTILQELVWIHLEVNEMEREHSSRCEGWNEREQSQKSISSAAKKTIKNNFWLCAPQSSP